MAERPESELFNGISCLTLETKETKNHHVHGRIGSDQDQEFHHRGPTLGKMLVRAKVFKTNQTNSILFRLQFLDLMLKRRDFIYIFTNFFP